MVANQKAQHSSTQKVGMCTSKWMRAEGQVAKPPSRLCRAGDAPQVVLVEFESVQFAYRGLWLPRVVIVTVTFPFDKVLALQRLDGRAVFRLLPHSDFSIAVIDDPFHIKPFFSLHNGGKRRGLHLVIAPDVWLEQGPVKHIVHSHVVWQIKFESDWLSVFTRTCPVVASVVQNGEGA